jgi:hydroxypyruvate reductase
LRRDAEEIWRAAVKAADARTAVERHLRLRRGELYAGGRRFRLAEFDRVFLVAAGKAAARMAGAVERLLGPRLTYGLVVTKHGHVTQRLKRCKVFTAAHPVPDENGLAAAAEVEQVLGLLHARDLLLVAISGGASALLPAPVPGISLAQKQKATDLLLRAGADIRELNTVRKHLSVLKGGRLAALAYPATVVALLLSDVIGDEPDVIGSGPTAPDPSTYADALEVLERYGLTRRVPGTVLRHLQRGQRGVEPETPKAGDPVFQKVVNIIVGSNRLSLEASAAAARKLGYRPMILSSTISGEARHAGNVHAQILREAIRSGTPAKPPVCLLSGGETTVTVKGRGRGGRNQEFALACAMALDGIADALAASIGTDGSDGPTDAAGAVVTGNTLGRARGLNLEARRFLEQNDSYSLFEALGDLVKTGPTGTNVMDIHLLLSRGALNKR